MAVQDYVYGVTLGALENRLHMGCGIQMGA
jgi:hypothetical protein